MTSRPPFVHELSHTSTPVRCLSPAPPIPGLQPPSSSSSAKLEDGKEWHSESSRSSDAADREEDYLSPTHMRPATSLSHSPPSRWRELWNPRRWRLPGKFSYQQIPSISVDSLNLDALREFREGRLPWQERKRRCGWVLLPGRLSLSLTKAIALAIGFIVVLGLLIGGYKHARPMKEENNDVPFFWMHYHRLNGYYNGVRTLVPFSQWVPENGWNLTEPLTMQDAKERMEKQTKLPTTPPMEPTVYSPYPDYASEEYLKDHHPVATCYLDEEETLKLPEVLAYPGVPQHFPEPLFGSHTTLGMREDMCFDRFGRLGPYGYGDKNAQKGFGPGTNSEHAGSEKVFETNAYVNYTNVDWGAAQKRCYEKNKARFAKEDSTSSKKRVPRQAYVLRTWEGFEYDQHYMFSLRAMVNELALKTGGEYDVHFLVHIKNNSIPIWADEATYNATLEANVPREFRSMATLWSEAQLVPYYPDPFDNNFANMAGSSIHGVYRSAHFALQWFAQKHPEYDYFWNWEMDLRYTGHYYEFHSAVSSWGASQPRKGLWERGKRFYIPSLHGTYETFTEMVEHETINADKPVNNEVQSGPVPIWGPVNTFENGGMLPTPNTSIPPTSYHDDKYTWGVGEPADLLVFNPLFDPSTTNWVFRDDATGYLTTLPPPPRRAAIITVARLSRQLLQTMHEETFAMKHTMFPEMFPASIALHHGFKAVFVPHPVYFDRDWRSEYAGEVFNHPKEVHESPFGWGEHNLGGASFYYNSGFSGALWRRWLGLSENGEGGRKQEEGAWGTGRMCVRGALLHPVKHERGEVA